MFYDGGTIVFGVCSLTHQPWTCLRHSSYRCANNYSVRICCVTRLWYYRARACYINTHICRHATTIRYARGTCFCDVFSLAGFQICLSLLQKGRARYESKLLIPFSCKARVASGQTLDGLFAHWQWHTKATRLCCLEQPMGPFARAYFVYWYRKKLNSLNYQQ